MTCQMKPTFIPLIRWCQWVKVNLLQILQVPLIKSMVCLTIILLYKCHITFHIRCKEGFKWAHGRTPGFPSMERLGVGVKKFMHDMFVLIISIFETPCLGTNIVFNKMRSLHITMRWNHIDIHFCTKGLVQCNMYK